MTPDQPAGLHELIANRYQGLDEPALRLLRSHGLSTLLAWQALECGDASHPHERVAIWRHELRAAAILEAVWAREIRQVLDALAAAGIPCLFLKGSSMAYLGYPRPELRPRSDTDILFPDPESAQTAARLLSQLGFLETIPLPSGRWGPYQFGYARRTLGGAQLHIDLHWRVSNVQHFARALAWPDLFAAKQAMAPLGPWAFGLHPVHALTLAATHRYGNFLDGVADRAIWLYDIHRLGQALDASGWGQFASLAVERRIAGVCLTALHDCDRWFHLPVPDGIRQTLESSAHADYFAPVGRRIGRLRREWLEHSALPSWRSRAEWAWGRAASKAHALWGVPRPKGTAPD